MLPLGAIMMGVGAAGQIGSMIGGLVGGSGVNGKGRMKRAVEAQGKMAQAQADLAPALSGYSKAQGSIAELLMSQGTQLGSVAGEQMQVARQRGEAVSTAAKYFEAAMDVTSPLFRQTAANEEVKLRRAISEGVMASAQMGRQARARGLTAGSRNEREDEGRGRAVAAGYAQAALQAEDLAAGKLRQTGASMLEIAQGLGGVANTMAEAGGTYARQGAMYGAAGDSIQQGARIVGLQGDLLSGAAQTSRGALNQGMQMAEMEMAQQQVQREKWSQIFDTMGTIGTAMGGVGQINKMFGGGAKSGGFPSGFPIQNNAMFNIPYFVK